MIGEVINIGIYDKFNRRNKLWSCDKLSNNTTCTRDIKTLNLQ